MAARVLIKFDRVVPPYQPGEIASFPPPTAKGYIATGAAHVCDADGKPMPEWDKGQLVDPLKPLPATAAQPDLVGDQAKDKRDPDKRGK